MRLRPLLSCLALIPLAAAAHHSPSMFDNSRQLTLTGTVRDFQWTNPHSYIQLVVTADDGSQQEWSLEMGASVYLYNQGWRPGTVAPGDTITATVVPLRNGSNGGLLMDAVTADGARLAATARRDAPAKPSAASAAAPSRAWTGVWIAEGLTADISGFPPRTARWYKLLGDEAPWNDNGRQRFMEAMSNNGTKKADGWGFPMMMDSAAPLQFLVTPDETLIINMYRDVRHIYTDGRALPGEANRWPTTWGTSVGRWDGDTLVIETASVRYPPRYFFSSPPLTEDARYVERIRMTAPDRIESTMTITDPATLAEPWVIDLVYVPAPGMDRMIHDDYDNDRSAVDGDSFTILPAGDRNVAGGDER
jgi:hypothetical protein